MTIWAVLRAEQILGALPETGMGIEYGPLDRPLVPPNGPRTVRYVDVFSRDELVAKYSASPTVNTNEIPEIGIETWSFGNDHQFAAT